LPFGAPTSARCGTDTEGVRYDGEYIFDESTGLADVKAKVTFPPNVNAVFGVSNPYEWAFGITTRINPKQNSGAVAVKTSMGQNNQCSVCLSSEPAGCSIACDAAINRLGRSPSGSREGKSLNMHHQGFAMPAGVVSP
jgi:hypothetical protein